MTEQYIDQGTTATFQISCNPSFMNRLTITTTQSKVKDKDMADTEKWQLKIM